MSHKSFFADFLDDWAHPRRRALALTIQTLLFVMSEVAIMAIELLALFDILFNISNSANTV